MNRISAFAVVAILCSSVAQAQDPSGNKTSLPHMLRLNGTVAATVADPRSATVGMTFALYTDQSGGTPLWQEVQNVTVDATGHYSVVLGANSKDGVPAELFTSNEARWLGVQVEQQAEQPRVLLVSVPYALKAGDAETVGGHPLSDFVMTRPSTTTTSSTTASTTTSTTAPTSTAAKSRLGVAPNTVLNPTPTATGTTNFAAKFDAASNLINSSIFDNGFVGIGTTTPAFNLDVVGGIQAQAAAFPQINFKQTGGGGSVAQEWRYQINPDGSYRIYDITGGIVPRFVMTQAGSVGIGTASPAFNLDVVGGMQAQAAAFPQINFKQTGGVAQEYRYQINPDGSYHIYDITSGIKSRFTLTQAGSIGIGTDTPGFNLDVVGGIQAQAASFPQINFKQTGGTAQEYRYQINPDGVYHIYDITHGVASRFVLTPAGNIGINNDAPGQKLSVGGMIESLGGFKFPDGSVQTTAATGGSGGNITGVALALPNTSSSSVGVITLGGTLFLHNFGTSNTFVGASAGNVTMDPVNASNNTAVGFSALAANTTGHGHAAFGYSALSANTTGLQNSAFGSVALEATSTGSANAAFGNNAMTNNTTGANNAGFGYAVLNHNTTANLNSAFGYEALITNTTGANNSAFGEGALFNLNGGANNLALGALSGSALTGIEHDNIYLDNVGVAGESQTTRIGTGQTATFIAGISGRTSASGVAVFINTSGQLGTVTSSRRFKYAIADMGAESDLLMKLRPVAFYYKPEVDETQTRQYGLVAEEVAKVAPQLVVYDENGAPQTVRYHFVNAMLLNEVQKQQRLVEEQEKTIARQQAEIQDMAARLARLEALATAKR